MMLYAVKLRGRDHAQFQYAKDAEGYVAMVSDPDHSRATRINYVAGKKLPEGQTRLLYEREDYTIEEIESGRAVVGTTGHGHAILAALERSGS